MQIKQEAFFLPVAGGECFCIWRAPHNATRLRGLVIHLPAFAEEMNKARRTSALAARAFAAHGFGVLQFDPVGSGDSSGDFGDATLERWVDNAVCAVTWARQRSDAGLWLWSVRAGALLIPSLLLRLDAAASVLLWQPVISGRQFLRQFLRLSSATVLFKQSVAGDSTRALRERLQAGHSVEVGGYRISPAMANDLEHANFALSPGDVRQLIWFEVSGMAIPELSPAARTNIEALRFTGLDVAAAALQGPGFWQSVDIEESPQLVAASLSAISQG